MILMSQQTQLTREESSKFSLLRWFTIREYRHSLKNKVSLSIILMYLGDKNIEEENNDDEELTPEETLKYKIYE